MTTVFIVVGVVGILAGVAAVAFGLGYVAGRTAGVTRERAESHGSRGGPTIPLDVLISKDPEVRKRWGL